MIKSQPISIEFVFYSQIWALLPLKYTPLWCMMAAAASHSLSQGQQEKISILDNSNESLGIVFLLLA